MRYLTEFIKESLKKRAVFVAGPRQVGKTTLALSLISKNANTRHPAYLNWDYGPSAEKIRKTQLPPNEFILVFDELHKFKTWKKWIKGIIDVEGTDRKIIVTGSARLDVFQKGGDSLFGRYRYVRLHPFSFRELDIKELSNEQKIEKLLTFGGFPEPLFGESIRTLKLWQKERVRRIMREDVRDLTTIQNLSGLETLAEMLPERVGSPLSIQSLSEDLQVDHKTVKRWIQTFESMYFCFRIAPFGGGKRNSKFRAVKKEQKLFLWDWSPIEDIGARWENMVASQLLKFCHWHEDTEGDTMELRFLRSVERHEIDFVILKNGKPEFAVECKSSEKGLSPSIKYFAERTTIPYFYQVHRGRADFEIKNARVLPFWKFCEVLKMP